MNVWLWGGFVAFCAAIVCRDLLLARHGARGWRNRFGALSDLPALGAGIATLVVSLAVGTQKSVDFTGVWAGAVFWAVAVAEGVHLVRFTTNRCDAPVS